MCLKNKVYICENDCKNFIMEKILHAIRSIKNDILKGELKNSYGCVNETKVLAKEFLLRAGNPSLQDVWKHYNDSDDLSVERTLLWQTYLMLRDNQ